MKKLIDETVQSLVEWLRLGYSLCISLSWGKDSTAVLVLALEAIQRAKSSGIQVPQCGHMQFGSRLGKGSIGDMAQQASACAFTAEVGKEAVKFALNAAATKTAQCGDQCRQGQFARAGEGLWEIRVTSLSRKSRALDVFGQPG